MREGDSGFGGAGDDILSVIDDLPSILNGGGGYDTLRFEGGYDITGATIVSVEQLNLRARVFPDASMTAAQLGQFALVSGYDAAADDAELTLTQGGTATVTLSATLTDAFQLNGSAQNDLITFNATYAGTIFFFGDDGNDTVNAGAGNDELDAEDGDDTLNGLGGNDLIEGGLGADVLRGGAGDDTLAGYRDGATDSSDNAADQLLGEAGNDRLLIHAGDTGDGGIGNDVIVAAAAATLIGGDGDDRLIGSTGNDTLAGGAGVDEASYERSSQAVTADLVIAGAQNTGGGGTDVISLVENLTGGSGSDTLFGTAGANVLRGLGGNDVLDGRGGRDTASYLGANGVSVDLRIGGQQNTIGAGFDTLIAIEDLIGSDGADTLTGTGADNVIEGGGGTDVIDGLGGIDTASYAGAGQLVVVSLAVAGIQNTIGGGLDTLIGMENLRGSAFGDTLTGDASANRLEGGDGGDTLRGLGGVDTLVGGAGADTLDGGTGADVLEGGTGNDTYLIDVAGDVLVEVAAASGGTDTVRTALTWTLAAGFEALALTGTGPSEGVGNAASNTLSGNGAANVLRGLDGNDTLNGGPGDDTLIGGAGVDTLNGGAGADEFVFALASESPLATPDVITAFDVAGNMPGDVIDLAAIDANGAAAGNGVFLFGQTGLGGLWRVNVGDDTFVYGNLDADTDAEFALRITDGAVGAGVYTAADFVL